MSPLLSLQPRTFPNRIADLGFTTLLPADWIQHDLPSEDLEFSDATVFVPLGIVTAPHAAIVFAFAARPAHENGTLHDWAWYHLNHHKLQPRAVGRGVVAGVPAVSGEAVQTTELGPMLVRFAFLEDGNRLLNLTLTAPEVFADSVRDAWLAMLKTFSLQTPRGSRFPCEDHPDNSPAAPIPEPWLEKAGADAERADVPSQFKAPVPEPGERPEMEHFALANDGGSLHPDHPINLNLRDRGAGFVPAVTVRDDDGRRATLHSGSIMAQFDVPYGWHVVEDGQRVLVFEPRGQVQISLNLIPRRGRSSQEILDDIEAEMRRDYPNPEFLRLELGQIEALGARGIADGGDAMEQYHMLHPCRDESMVLRARVTATPDRAAAAGNLAELILDNCVFDPVEERAGPPTPEPQPPQPAAPEPASAEPSSGDSRPAWWHKALELEAEDRLEEAEQTIKDRCPHMGFAYATADMYRHRMRRLKAAGDTAGALEAFTKSSDFIFFYASLATSGGEGAALSAERDQFRAGLVAEYGIDPEARR